MKGVGMQDKPVSADVNASSLAKRTAGFSGAELSNLVNEAALSAGKGGLPQITSALLDDAQDKVLMGSERRFAISPLTLCIHNIEVSCRSGTEPVWLAGKGQCMREELSNFETGRHLQI